MNNMLRIIIDDKKRSNTKSKRSKNIVKKCNELAQLCGLEVTLVIFDKK